MRTTILAVTAALILAGCMAPDSPSVNSEAEFRLSGTFTENATREDFAGFEAGLPEGAEVAYLESFPIQFILTGISAQQCEQALAFAQEQPYVQRIGACEPVAHPENPDEPASSEG